MKIFHCVFLLSKSLETLFHLCGWIYSIITWKHCPIYRPFVREIDMSILPTKRPKMCDIWCFLLLVWTSYWTSVHVVSDLRLHSTHRDGNCFCCWPPNTQPTFGAKCDLHENNLLHQAMIHFHEIWPFASERKTVGWLLSVCWLICVNVIWKWELSHILANPYLKIVFEMQI